MFFQIFLYNTEMQLLSSSSLPILRRKAVSSIANSYFAEANGLYLQITAFSLLTDMEFHSQKTEKKHKLLN